MNDAKSKILAAASDLFLEGGSSALSVRAISKRAGLSTIGIYSHFNGKQGILDELYIEGFELVAAAMDRDQGFPSPRDAILEGVKGYLHIADKYEAHYRLIFGESDASYTPSPEAQEASQKAFARLIEGVSILLPVSASFQEKQKTALEIWALVHGFVSLKHHAVSSVLELEDWNELTLHAMGTHVDGILLKNSVTANDS
ncbi:MAG: AcrR family transcriptional regulator [Paraglaciecola sp.]|jgi:AcrR family transcriptional regulator